MKVRICGLILLVLSLIAINLSAASAGSPSEPVQVAWLGKSRDARSALETPPSQRISLVAVTPTHTRTGAPSVFLGPYAVILVAPDDVLNIRSGPGTSNRIVGSFSPTETGVMRTGPSANLRGGAVWVEVQKPGGGKGWVNFHYLTEYVSSEAFCADSRVNALITNLGNAILTRNGVQLSNLVSPRHGVTVYLWRHGGRSVTFMPRSARWLFSSTYRHNWGTEPGSGATTIGSFQNVVLPKLQDVFSSSSYTLTCNSLGDAPQLVIDIWPSIYTNINYYTIYKPGTPGLEMDFRYWLMGVEYVNGQPYVFSLIHFQWEP
ncbi:MAG: SH3 domain-containing protein [Anaerolineales bacterium]|nr:SH3 domain-containing protein [Anaerolineales bacterium]